LAILLYALTETCYNGYTIHPTQHILHIGTRQNNVNTWEIYYLLLLAAVLNTDFILVGIELCYLNSAATANIILLAIRISSNCLKDIGKRNLFLILLFKTINDLNRVIALTRKMSKFWRTEDNFGKWREEDFL